MTSRVGAAISIAALVALGAMTMTRAEVVDPTVATSFGSNGTSPKWASDRGGGPRTGRTIALPMNPHLRWSRSNLGRVDWPIAVDSEGNLVVVVAPSGGGLEGQLVELANNNGTPKSVTKLRSPSADLEGLAALQPDTAAGAPIVLNNGTRVVVTIRGYAIGVAPGGTVMFRTRVASELASVPRVGLAPLPGGGFAVARRPEILELDSHGAIVDRVRLDVAPFVAARDNGEVLGVNNQGELYSWRALRVPKLIGTFGDKSASSDGACRGGLAVDGSSLPGGRRERAVCAGEGLVEQIDLVTGTRKALLPRLPLPYRTAPAIGTKGDVAVVIAGGTLLGVGALGNDIGPFEVPGAAAISLGKDGGVAYIPALNEVAPIIADDGAISWASSDGVAIARSGIVSKIAKCGGVFGSSTAALASAGPGTLAVACADGKVELYADK